MTQWYDTVAWHSGIAQWHRTVASPGHAVHLSVRISVCTSECAAWCVTERSTSCLEAYMARHAHAMAHHITPLTALFDPP